MTGSVDVQPAEPETSAPAMADETPLDPDRICETCSWPVGAFDHAARHRWTLYWNGLRTTPAELP